MQNFKSLQVWEKSHKLTLSIYQATATFRKEELCGLVSQMRRSSASIPTNIAEGCGRAGNAELAHFCQIAMGSASELEYQILLAHDLSFLSDLSYQQLDTHLTEVKRMLNSFIQRLRQS
ncbi:MAG: four helix bundle protein [Chitinophagaceae bacterium]|nr:four helix bundle protein [Anaerolineae bacterium]